MPYSEKKKYRNKQRLVRNNYIKEKNRIISRLNEINSNYIRDLRKWEEEIDYKLQSPIEQIKNDEYEKYSPIRKNIWTNLRYAPSKNSAGRNWMTYFCLKKKNKKFPIDIMDIINQFLNWVPAGCWYINDGTLENYITDFVNCSYHCNICGIKYITSIYDNLCSYQCYEIYLRKLIYDNYEDYIIEIRNTYEIMNSPIINDSLDMINLYVDSIMYKYDNIYDYMEFKNESVSTNTYYPVVKYKDREREEQIEIEMKYDHPLLNLDGCEIFHLKYMLTAYSDDENDDIWNRHRPHWDEFLVNVFKN